MQPSGELKEGDAKIIANQLFENLNELPSKFNVNKVVVHNQ